MTRGAVLAILAWVCLTCAGVAQTLSFPALSGRVVDEAGLLSPSDRASLTQSLADLETKTTDQLVVVTLKTLQGSSIEGYGYQLGRQWRIGQKDTDSGVLLIVAATERKVRIEVGYGLEGTLTDAATKLIIENSIIPRFKVGDFPGGIKDGAAAIIQVLGGDATDAQARPAQTSRLAGAQPGGDIPTWLFIVLALGGAGLLVLCSVTRGGGICQGIMQVLFLVLLSGRGGSSRGGGSFSGGGGSFGGGGSSGNW